MFIKVTKKQKAGKSYEQYQLKESYRTPAGPRNRVVFNLGADLDLSKEERKLLADTIEAILYNQEQLFPVGSSIRDMAENYARQIQAKRLTQAAENDDTEESQKNIKKAPDYETVDINSVNTTENRSIGFENIIKSQLEDYKFDHILKRLDFSEKEIDYAKISIIGKICHPASERETVRWSKEDSAVCELLESHVKVYDNALHKAARMLFEHQETIEESLAKEAKSQFDLDENIILYDLTNTFFESSKPGSAIAKHGRSKEKRSDCPLMTIALTVDEDGFPKRSQMLEGNISEPRTLDKALCQIKDYSFGQLPLSKKTVVIDAGIATEENLTLLKERGYSYIAVSRKNSCDTNLWKDSTEEILTLKNNKDQLKIKVARKDEELYLLCHSDIKEKKELAIIQQKMSRFEKELQILKEGLKKPRARNGYEQILERIGRLKQKYGVGYLYDIEVIKETHDKSKNKSKAIDVVFKRNSNSIKRLESAGNYVLRTDRVDLDNESISKIHRSLTTIEGCFKYMKSDLGLRPNHHQKDENSTAHIFVVVIALHVITAILKKLKNNKISHTISTLRNVLSNHRRVTTVFNTDDDHVLEIRNTGTPTARQREIYRALKVKQKPLNTIKLKIPAKRNIVH